MTLAPTSRPVQRSHKWHWIGGVGLGLVGAVVLLVLLWNWSWFRPLVEVRASAALGRMVTIERLEVHPGRQTVIVANGLRIANPAGLQGPDFAAIARLSVTFDAASWLHTRRIRLKLIEVDHPVFNLVQTADGQNNWTLAVLAPDPDAAPGVQVGDIIIDGGTAHLVAPRGGADMDMTITTGTARTASTSPGGPPSDSADAGRALIIEAKGTYESQPITAHAVGGAILALSTTSHFPIDFTLSSGATRITLKGTIRDPLRLAGADLNLSLAGPDMALLYPLTGIATPPTPPYTVTGKLDFGQRRIRFTNMVGKVGSSDLNGALEFDPHGKRRVLTGTLTSRVVDMDDLAGFIGSQPGRLATPGQTPEQVAAVKRAEANPKLLPTMRVSVPKIRSTDVHITYRGDKIMGQNMPFDSLSTKMDIEDGHIRLTPLRLGIGGGALTGNFDLNPVGDELDANTTMAVEHVNIGKLLASAGLGSGQGSIDGTAWLKGRGASLSAILAHGNGALDVRMPLGGEVNALLLDLSGLQFGRAFLSALGVADKETINCMVADFDLRDGTLTSRTLAADTTQHVITGGGRIDLSRELVDMYLHTEARHLSIGTLATPIRITGPFKDLSYAPDPGLAVRGGVAVGLGVLFPPAAVLPTIQFGVGDKSPCGEAKK